MQMNLCLTETEIRINSAQQYTDLDYTTFLRIPCQLACFWFLECLFFIVPVSVCVCKCVCLCVFGWKSKGKFSAEAPTWRLWNWKRYLVQPLETSHDCNHRDSRGLRSSSSLNPTDVPTKILRSIFLKSGVAVSLQLPEPEDPGNRREGSRWRKSVWVTPRLNI